MLFADELFESLVVCLDTESVRRVVDFRVAQSVQGRLSMLAGRVNEGLATEAELAEYEALVSAADFISVLKLKARRRLQEQAAPVGVRGVDILGVAGTLDQVSAREMREAIEEGCGMQSIGYGITPENRHGETEWGDAAGKEEW